MPWHKFRERPILWIKQINFFSQLDQPCNWKIFEHDNAAMLVKQLASHGYERVDDEYDVMIVLDLDAIPERLVAPVAKDVRRLNMQTRSRMWSLY